MAFSSTIDGKEHIGNRSMAWGTWQDDEATGGDIDTGLVLCESIMITNKGDALETSGTGIINDTFPVAGNAVTIVCTTGDAGYWRAIGT